MIYRVDARRDPDAELAREIKRRINSNLVRVAREVKLHQSLGAPRGKAEPITRRGMNEAYPHRIEGDYAAYVINAAGSGMLERVLKPVLAELPKLIDANDKNRSGMRSLFDPGTRVLELFADVRKQLPSRQVIAKDALRYAELTSKHQREQLGKQVAKALGVNVLAGTRIGGPRFDSMTPAPAVRDITARLRVDSRARHGYRRDSVERRVAGFVPENVSLITSLQNRSLDDIQSMITRGFVAGERNETLARDIRERFGILDSYARRIGRDQIGKLNGQITAERHQELGVRSFIWRTVGDERVREEHEDINGNEYDYPDGHPTEGLPGEPIQCRCTEEPVFGELQAMIDGEPIEEPFELDLPSADLDLYGELGEEFGQPAAAAAPAVQVQVQVQVPAEIEEYAIPRTEAWANENMPKVVTTKQREAVEVYQGGEYKAVNANLRETKRFGEVPKESQELSNGMTIGEVVTNIDKAIAKSRTPAPMIGYRGETGRTFKIGDKVTDPAYLSLSLSPKVAEGFTKPQGLTIGAPAPSGQMLEIDLPKGQKALYVSGAIGGAEQELLLPRGTTLEIVSITGDRVRAQIVKRNPAAEARAQRAAERAAEQERIEAAAAAARAAAVAAREAEAEAARIAAERAAAEAARAAEAEVRAAEAAAARAAEEAAAKEAARVAAEALKAEERAARAAEKAAAKELARAEREAARETAKAEKVAARESERVAKAAAKAEARALKKAMEAPKNPARVAAGRIAGEKSAEKQRELLSAIRSNLAPELHVIWDRDGAAFLKEIRGRIKDERDTINASSTVSQAFAETYGSGGETMYGNEGDRYARRAEVEAEQSVAWADEQTANWYAQEQRRYDEEMAAAAESGESGATPEAAEATEETEVAEEVAEEIAEIEDAPAEVASQVYDDEVPF